MIGAPCWARLAAWGMLAATGAVPSLAGDGPQVFSLTDPQDGRKVGVARPAGVLHIVYFATWCPGCVAELPELADLEERWTERDYRLLLVAVNTRQTPERLTKFIQSANPPGRLLFDADGQAERRMRVEQLPTHVLLGPDGSELARAGRLVDIHELLLHVLQGGGPGQR